MVKLIASDLDGTFFYDDHTAPQANLDAVKRFQDAGYEFIAVTGRDYPSVVQILEGRSLGCECIAVSGAEVRGKDGKVIDCVTFSYDLLEQLEALVKQFDVHICYYDENGYYTVGDEEYRDEFLVDEISILFHSGTPEEIRAHEVYQKRIKLLGLLGDIREFREKGIGVTKVFAFHHDAERVKKARQALTVVEDKVDMLSAFAATIEIIDKEAQKGPVLKKYVEERGYSMDEVAVVGDSPNDLSMFAEDFGVKVVVANATPDLKEIATHITKSNMENGVEYLVDKILAGQLDDLKK